MKMQIICLTLALKNAGLDSRDENSNTRKNILSHIQGFFSLTDEVSD